MPGSRREHPLREHVRGVGYVVLITGAVLLAGLGLIALFALAMA